MKTFKKILKTFLLLFVYVNFTYSQNLPDITNEFEYIIAETKRRCEDLKEKWPVNEQTFENDLKYLERKRNLSIEKSLSSNHRYLSSWQNMKSRVNYIKNAYQTGSKGDLKNTVFRKYNIKNSGKVVYNGKIYTVEQLGNINFGIACKAIGIPITMSTCAAGCYQIVASQCIPLTTEKARKYLRAIKNAVSNEELRGSCLDYKNDTKMIKLGYNWY